jgi:glycosyltransferase involved in cell wall biosynthesis
MYCGLCFRDNALVSALRAMGHDVLMVPLYLPLTLDETDQSAGTPIFFSGINVYLDQKSTLFRRAPGWFHQVFTSRRLLKWAAGRAARTRAEGLGEITLSMLRGEAGNQARELDDLLGWLKTQPRPEVICLSTILLAGMVRRLKTELHAPVVCNLQGEDAFLDGLAEPDRTRCWAALAERAAEVDLFVAPSRYFGDLMRERLRLPAERVRVIYNGISLEGYSDEGRGSSATDSRPPILGYFARMCPEKGLDTLVEAYILLRQNQRLKDLRLHIGGGCGPTDEPFVAALRQRLSGHNLLGEVEFHPNLDRVGKVDFLHTLSAFSVPAQYGEAFGLYVIEALAAGVPVVQPRTAAFPELIEAAGGGRLCEAGDPKALAQALEELLLQPEAARALGQAGRRVVFDKFSAEAMAHATLEVYRELTQPRSRSPALSNS